MILEPQEKFRLGEIEKILDKEKELRFSSKTFRQITKAQKIVLKLSKSSKAIYGINTGFGRLAQTRISEKDLVRLQLNLLRSHASGIGEPLERRSLRRLLLLRAISLGKGYSGISSELLNRHLEYWNLDLVPFIPEQGSVGASGDLAPLAHLGITFIGEGEFVEGTKRRSTKEVLRKSKLQAVSIGPKEGLALVNGTQFSLALAMEARSQLHHLLPWMELAAAFSIEAHRATAEVFREDLHALKDHPHQQEVARRFSRMLANSPHGKSHKDCSLVQDSYSFRCIPQILGPAYSLLEKADELLEGELNSVSDNPVVFTKKAELVSGGHFHAQSVSMACDLMALSTTTLGNLLERRVDQLCNPLTTRGSSFLADRPGVESGMMIVHTALAALASENKTLAVPASADTIPTNGNQEDHVSMAPWAARKSLQALKNFRRMIAAEILVAVRGCVHESTRSGKAFSPFVERSLKTLALAIPSIFRSGDRVFGNDWRLLEAYILKTSVGEFGERH